LKVEWKAATSGRGKDSKNRHTCRNRDHWSRLSMNIFNFYSHRSVGR